MIKNKNGITLIALIITIIVLLILAGVVINMTLGNDGIISKAQSAVDKYANAENHELEDINNYSNLINYYTLGNRNYEEPIKLIATESNIKQYYGHSASSNGNDKSLLKIIEIKNGFWIINYKIPSSDGSTPESGSYDLCDIDISSLGLSATPQVLCNANTNQFCYWGYPCYEGYGKVSFVDKNTLRISFIPKESECGVTYNSSHMYCTGVIPLIFL